MGALRYRHCKLNTRDMKEILNNEYSLKGVNPDNWLEIDGVIKRLSGKALIPKSAWFENIYKDSLQDTVPQDIHYLMEVARGTMTYGYFYYPIFSVAWEQLFRIAETAVVKKCEMEMILKPRYSFRGMIKWLYSRRIISKSSCDSWEKIVELRNIVSHPQRLNIVPPSLVFQTVHAVIGFINDLFTIIPDENKQVEGVLKGFVITQEGIPYSRFTSNGSRVVFGEEPHLFTSRKKVLRTKNRLRIVIKDATDVIGLENVQVPLNLEIEKVFEEH